jgi:phosphopantothenoylcysteine decarboxylase / phosphopantothenate---cysteine ligase
MTGSIACFKACQIVSKLVQAGHEVQVVLSKSASEFIGNATLEGLTGKPALVETFETGQMMGHIHWVRWADLIIVAPATANFINKAVSGIGDDLILTQFLAHDFKKPYLIAPAMNTAMYLHPVTQNSIQALKKMGVEILETASGVLACGEVGWGRLLDPDLIFQEIENHLNKKRLSTAPAMTVRKIPLKVLVTAGGTQESIDDVRVLSNRSTGATGASIADSLIQLGFDVTYLHARNAVKPKLHCRMEVFESFSDIEGKLKTILGEKDYRAVIHSAAVSDFSVDKSDGKIPSGNELQLKLKPNPKLVQHLREMAFNQNLNVIAFKMTSHAPLAEQKAAVKKLFTEAKPNWVVHNDLSEKQEAKHRFHIYDNQLTENAKSLNTKVELGLAIGRYLMELKNDIST